ncbi:MAG: sugar phosphate isomerase/epimerase [Candidatus Bathyarchaeota archaeon]|nr:sugar phosphate isomerase/epimerase [Candidatus Bathyarchaeota archaeon]
MSKPRIGLSMLYTLSESFNKMVKQLNKAPVKYIEIVDEGAHTLNNKRVKILKDAAKTHGFKYSVHAPFADINPASPSKPILKASLKRLKQSMQYANDLDAYLWVVHPGNKSGISTFYPGADWKQNIQSITELHKTAQDYGLKMAMENLPEKYNFLMKTPDDFKRFYTETGLTDIGIVLDTGHAHLEGQIQPFLKEIPDKLAHIHISDNHGETDEHLGLGEGTIDWQEFTTLVKAAKFSGTVLTEAVFSSKETLQRTQKLFA